MKSVKYAGLAGFSILQGYDRIFTQNSQNLYKFHIITRSFCFSSGLPFRTENVLFI